MQGSAQVAPMKWKGSALKTKPTAWVGGAGHWAWRGAKKPKAKK